MVWNIFYSPYIWNNHPNWLSYFSEGLKPPWPTNSVILGEWIMVHEWHPLFELSPRFWSPYVAISLGRLETKILKKTYYWVVRCWLQIVDPVIINTTQCRLLNCISIVVVMTWRWPLRKSDSPHEFLPKKSLNAGSVPMKTIELQAEFPVNFPSLGNNLWNTQLLLVNHQKNHHCCWWNCGISA